MKLSEKQKEELLEEYKDLAKQKARLYYMLGAEPEDIVQEGMIGLFKAIEAYDEDRGCSFKTFANLCIDRQIVSAVKIAGRKKHQILNGALSLDMPLSAEEPTTLGETLVSGTDADPQARVLTEEATQAILSPESGLLSKLERSVARGLLEGKDYRQIASELGRTPKSVDNTIQRVRNKLKAYFTEV